MHLLLVERLLLLSLARTRRSTPTSTPHCASGGFDLFSVGDGDEDDGLVRATVGAIAAEEALALQLDHLRGWSGGGSGQRGDGGGEGRGWRDE